MCRLRITYTVNNVLADKTEADKDRIKLCATWDEEEINMTLVSHCSFAGEVISLKVAETYFVNIIISSVLNILLFLFIYLSFLQ